MPQSIEELYAALEAARDRQTQIDIELRAAHGAWEQQAIEEKLAEFIEAGGVVGKTRVRRALATILRPLEPVVQLDEGPFIVIGMRKLEHADTIVFRLAKVRKDGQPFAVEACSSRLVAILPEDQPKEQ